MANVPVVALDESSPAGSDNIALGDNRIREYKTQVRQVMEVDHDFPSSGQSETAGQHKQVTLQEATDIGSGDTGVTILGAQTYDGKPELTYTDEDDNDIQITKAGKIMLASGRLENNVNLTSRNQAGDGDVNLIKANTSNQAEVTPALLASGGAILPEISAPTTAVNQGALYTKNDGDQTELYFREESNGDEVQITNGGVVSVSKAFGSWVDKSSSYGAQQASSDGFVLVKCIGNVNKDSEVTTYTDSNSNPTTVRQSSIVRGTDTPYLSTMTPVRKGDYWKVTITEIASINVFWIPLGS